MYHRVQAMREKRVCAGLDILHTRKMRGKI